MAKYVYPAIFTLEETGGYSINFPDVKNCFTDANTLAEAMENANDVLCFTLYDMERNDIDIPKASNIADIQHLIKENEFVSLVACDTIEYRKFYDNRAVKKTLSIPSWLNELAEKAGLNFSATLQEALKNQLNIS